MAKHLPNLINYKVSKSSFLNLSEKEILTNLLKKSFTETEDILERHILSDIYEKVSKSLETNFVYEDKWKD